MVIQQFQFPSIGRNFSYDFITPTSSSNKSYRLALATLPFLALYHPFSQGLERFCESARLIKAVYLGNINMDTVVSVTALISSLFFHPIGAVVTSLHDASINARHLYKACQEGNHPQAAKEFFQAISSVLYASSLLFENDRLKLATLSAQSLAGIVTSANHFDKGRKIEGIAALIFTRIKIAQLFKEIYQISEP